MITGRRYRAHPDERLAATLPAWIGCARVVYNRKNEEERYLSWLRRHAGLSPSWHLTGGLPEGASAFASNQAFSHLKGSKADEPWLHAVPSQVYRNAMYQRSQAWQRFFENPREVRPPGRRQKGIHDSILLTKEMFRWMSDGAIEIGTCRHPGGILRFHQHRPCSIPNSITVSRDGAGRWWVSYNCDDGIVPVSQKEVVASLAAKTDEQVADSVNAHDLGIVHSVTGSDGRVLSFGAKKLAKIARWKRRIKRLSRKLARQVKGSTHRERTKRKIARTHIRISDMRNDHAHQVSHRIVEHGEGTVIAFEALNVRGMLRKPKAVREEHGFAPNGAARKAGLNAAILNQSWGKIVNYARYKAVRAGRLVVTVDPRFSSQECSCCGHTSPANRPSQAGFHCQACGHTDNADANASAVLKKRAVALIFGVLGRRTDITPEEAATKLGLALSLAAHESGPRSTHLAA